MDAIEPYGRLTFLVRSNRNGIPDHLVDLASYKGNGACDCEDFLFRKRKALENGAKPGPSLRCRHILQTREWMMDQCIKEIAKTEYAHHD